MGIDLTREHVFPLSEGPKLVGRSTSCLRDWMNGGRESVSGRMVYLEGCLTLGGVQGTSEEAVQRFVAALNDEPLSTQDGGYRHRNGNNENGGSHE